MKSEFAKWYLETDREFGSLITQRVAAYIIGVSDESIRQKAEQGKLKVHQFEKMKFFELNEIKSIRIESIFRLIISMKFYIF